MGRRKTVQLELRVRSWGGRREGAGRPRTTRWVTHGRRPDFPKRFPQHITWRLRDELGNVRTEDCFAEVQRAFLKGHDRFGMRLVEFSIQHNHIHLVVEAEHRRSLTRGLQGLAVRVARAINRALGRKGKVFADRYHSRILSSPTQVRNAVEYVRHNFKKHQAKAGRWTHPFYIDPYSSMSGQACCYMINYDWGVPVVAAPATWMLRHVLNTAPISPRAPVPVH